MNTLYFVGGASGSGKTAIIPPLKNLLGNGLEVYDFDDIGVPENADKKWRQDSTEKWLQKLLNNDKPACLLGQITLGDILACPSAKNIDKINFCLLDVSDFERVKRVKNRPNSSYIDQNMLNWAAWLRMHHKDPQWTQSVLTEDASSILDFNTWTHLKKWEDKANIFILDTTALSLNEVAGAISDWIHNR